MTKVRRRGESCKFTSVSFAVFTRAVVKRDGTSADF